MTYKDQLKYFRESNFNLLDIEIAQEVDEANLFNRILTDKDFEKVCQLTEMTYLKSEGVSIEQIVHAIFKFIGEGRQLDTLTKWDIIEEACKL